MLEAHGVSVQSWGEDLIQFYCIFLKTYTNGIVILLLNEGEIDYTITGIMDQVQICTLGSDPKTWRCILQLHALSTWL